MSQGATGIFRAMLKRLLKAQTSRPLMVLLGALALSALSILFTSSMLEFKTSQSALISPDNRLMQMLKIADKFSEHDAFIVAVENRNTDRSMRFARALAPMLTADSRHFAQVFYRVDPAQFRPWALLYLKPGEIAELDNNLRRHQSFIQGLARSPGLVTFLEEINNEMASRMVGQLFTGFLKESFEDRPAGPSDLSFLLKALGEMKRAVEGLETFSSPWQSFFAKGVREEEPGEGYFWTEEKKYLLLFVAPNTKGGRPSSPGEALTALRGAVAAVRQRFPGVEAGVTGQKALDEDEKNIALKDISLSTVVSLIGLAALLLLFWRTVRRPLLQMITQIVSLSITFGLTTLAIGHLNLLSVTFAPMVLGLGIDYDIHWFSRYSEERGRSQQSAAQALEKTMEKIGPAIMLAAFSTGLAFLPLSLTRFRGLAELGLICGIGLIVSCLATICLLPSLIMLFDRPPSAASVPDSGPAIKPLMRITRQRAFVILAVTAIGTGLSVWAAHRINFDLNMLHLQSKDAESVAWETRLIEGSKHPSIYGVLFARSLAQVAEKTKTLKNLRTVSEMQSVENFLPQDQDSKIPLLRRIGPLIADIRSISAPSAPVDTARLKDALSRIRFKMDEASAEEWGASKPTEVQMKEARNLIDAIRRDFRAKELVSLSHRLKKFENRLIEDFEDKLSLLRENANARPMRVSDLPAPVRERFVGSDELYLIRVFPASDIWDPQFLGAFVGDLRSVDPDATGDPVTLHVFTKEFRDSSIRAALYALVLIFAFLAFTLRSVVLALSAIAPLVIGAVCTFGLMHLFGASLNLANTIFLPLVIGAGVEYGVIIVRRYQEREAPSAKTPLPLSTGRGVLLAGLTTTIGFGSLMISRHQGIHSLGLLTTLGSLTVLAVALFVLPALLWLLPVDTRGDTEERQVGSMEDCHKGNQEDQ